MRYLGRKLAFYLVAAWAAITINFAVPRLMPGNPVDILMTRISAAGGVVTPESKHSLELLLGYAGTESWWSQYWGYLSGLAHLDFGTSVTFFPSNVSTVIGQSLPWTVVLIGVSTILSFVIGTGLGALAGWRRGT